MKDSTFWDLLKMQTQVEYWACSFAQLVSKSACKRFIGGFGMYVRACTNVSECVCVCVCVCVPVSVCDPFPLSFWGLSGKIGAA
jgi:hypothetical protein